MDSAAKTSSVIMKEHVMPKILSVIDEGKKVTHSKLSEDFENALTNQLKKFKTKLPSTLNTDFVDICYPPIIQSGGVFSLKPSAISSDERLDSGIILCSLGARYKSFCSNIGRTFMIDPTKVFQLKKYLNYLIFSIGTRKKL
jgi:nucleosome binding factor SPN SPT16 subunit